MVWVHEMVEYYDKQLFPLPNMNKHRRFSARLSRCAKTITGGLVYIGIEPNYLRPPDYQTGTTPQHHQDWLMVRAKYIFRLQYMHFI